MSCILTTKDLTILEVMAERSEDLRSAHTQLLRQKIAAASVVFREDVAENVATLNSRLLFRAGDAEPEQRIISQARMSAPTGHFQPITTLRGLALLGLRTGQQLTIQTSSGDEEEITLLDVLHQPEAAQRRMLLGKLRTGPRLTLITGGLQAAPAIAGDYDDDPGPTAA